MVPDHGGAKRALDTFGWMRALIVSSPSFSRSMWAETASALSVLVALVPYAYGAESLPQRTTNGLLALYEFSEMAGEAAPEVVPDLAKFGEPNPLVGLRKGSIQLRDSGVVLKGDPLLRSQRPASEVVDAIQATSEFSIEAWITPDNDRQSGPARIATISGGTTQRNFTLGQDGDRFDVRLRSTRTDANGLPSLATPTKTVLAQKRNHVVFTRRRTGQTKLFVNGKLTATGQVAGDFRNWDAGFHLAVGNEVGGERAWNGIVHLIAVYRVALYEEEVGRNYRAGITESSAIASKDATRVRRGIELAYDFGEADGAMNDRVQSSPSTQLVLSKTGIRREPGRVQIRKAGRLRSRKPLRGFVGKVRRSGSFTLEAWIRPANLSQSGPARIVTLSQDGSNRNFTLGQDEDRFEVRFRTTRTSENGIPSLVSPRNVVKTKLTHVAYTRATDGRTALYVDGKSVAAGKVEGTTENWNDRYHLLVGDEDRDRRPWQGDMSYVALYSRRLTAEEVLINFQAGPGSTTSDHAIPQVVDPRITKFETQIAPLLSEHCLECHDAAGKKGGLDLSRRDLAYAGGDTGKALVPGNLVDSILWDSIESDSMPLERSPLSGKEKELIKSWIEEGAVWSLEKIDPAIYSHGGKAESWVQRLTVAEYIATVRDTFDVDIETEARRLLPRDLRADGFSNTAYNLTVDLKHVDAYAQLARIIVDRLDVDGFARRFSRSRKFTDNDMGKLISGMGKHVFRGPLSEREIVSYRGITTSTAAAGGDFTEAVGFVLEAMLQSPRFLYRLEMQSADESRWPVDSFELASRMSYILWGAPPDAELIQLATDDALFGRELNRQLDRMMEDPRARERSKQFVTDWLNLDRLSSMQPDVQKFPDWKPDLASDMRAETLAYFDDVVWQQRRPIGELLNSQVMFVTPRLARHYGLKADAEWLGPTDRAAGTQLVKIDVGKDASRGGLLTQGSILTIGGDHASMVTRGLFIMHDLLRGVVRDPPPCVDTTPVPARPGLSNRGVSMARIANESCGGCHSRFEPLAFGLERYDGLGVFRKQDEHGNSLREDGQLMVPGAEKAMNYATVAELADLLASSERVYESLTWKITQFALGRPLGAEDARIMNKIVAQSRSRGGRYTDVMAEIILSDLVQFTRRHRNDDNQE